jgi:hypothetical protein
VSSAKVLILNPEPHAYELLALTFVVVVQRHIRGQYASQLVLGFLMRFVEVLHFGTKAM